MRIPNSSYTDAAQSQSDISRTQSTTAYGAPGTRVTGSSSSYSDDVNLSSLSRLVQSSSEARSEQIAALKKLVKSGDYEIPAGQLSRSLISETLASSEESWAR